MRRATRPALGLGSGASAGLVWGLAFLVPEVVHAGSVELTFARYAIYGLASVALLVWQWPALRPRMTGVAWRSAFMFAVSGNVGYYLLVVLGIRLVSAPVTVTVIGTIPITVALIGNLRHRVFPFRLLIAPLALVAAGITLVNSVEFLAGTARPDATTGQQLVGLACAFGALALWTSYGVANASFLQR